MNVGIFSVVLLPRKPHSPMDSEDQTRQTARCLVKPPKQIGRRSKLWRDRFFRADHWLPNFFGGNLGLKLLATESKALGSGMPWSWTASLKALSA